MCVDDRRLRHLVDLKNVAEPRDIERKVNVLFLVFSQQIIFCIQLKTIKNIVSIC